MKPVDFPEANLTLTPPSGSEEIGSLEVCKTAYEYVSCWQPSDDERAAIAAGGAVYVVVLQTVAGGCPPIFVSGIPPFEPLPASIPDEVN